MIACAVQVKIKELLALGIEGIKTLKYTRFQDNFFCRELYFQQVVYILSKMLHENLKVYV